MFGFDAVKNLTVSIAQVEASLAAETTPGLIELKKAALERLNARLVRELEVADL